jgi:hypothetical protein
LHATFAHVSNNPFIKYIVSTTHKPLYSFIISSSKVQATKNLNDIPQKKCEFVHYLQFYVHLRPKSSLNERQIMENRLSFGDRMKTMSLLPKPLSHAHIVNNK